MYALGNYQDKNPRVVYNWIISSLDSSFVPATGLIQQAVMRNKCGRVITYHRYLSFVVTSQAALLAWHMNRYYCPNAKSTWSTYKTAQLKVRRLYEIVQLNDSSGSGRRTMGVRIGVIWISPSVLYYQSKVTFCISD